MTGPTTDGQAAGRWHDSTQQQQALGYVLKVEADLIIDDLETELAQANEAAKLLEGLTPGGSEFVNNPERCAEFIHARLDSAGALAAERNQLREELARVTAERGALQSQLFGKLMTNDDGCSCPHDGPCNDWCALHGEDYKRRFTIGTYATLSLRTEKAEAELTALKDSAVDYEIAQRIYRGYEDSVRRFIAVHPEFTYEQVLTTPATEANEQEETQ